MYFRARFGKASRGRVFQTICQVNSRLLSTKVTTRWLNSENSRVHFNSFIYLVLFYIVSFIIKMLLKLWNALPSSSLFDSFLHRDSYGTINSREILFPFLSRHEWPQNGSLKIALPTWNQAQCRIGDVFSGEGLVGSFLSPFLGLWLRRLRDNLRECSRGVNERR